MDSSQKGRKSGSGMNRRRFLSKGSLALFGTMLGTNIVYGKLLPEGVVPLALLDQDLPKGKHPELSVLNDRPWNAEAPPHLLDQAITSADRLFIRNNGIPPENINPNNWTLTIDGEAAKNSKTYTLAELKSRFQHHTYQLTLECGGNGRSEFNPPAKGNQWSLGAVGCSAWTGVRLRDVLEDVGYTSKAVYIGYYGADTHLSGDPTKVVISRGVPMEKALEDETVIAWALNGKDIPLMNGHPLRLVIGGWPASVSGKWLKRIAIRDKVHDGPKMKGQSYRVPCKPVPPGTKVKDEDMCIIESMPVKSLITYPKTGGILKGKSSLEIRGKAWAGDLSVTKMEVSTDFGSTWKPANLDPAPNKMSWQLWSATVSFPEKGYYEVWARATDSNGLSQPMVLPGWNPRGYLNNACHRIAVQVK